MFPHICPWWLAYTFDNRARRLFQKPEVILGPYVRPGMTVMDLGCGMGFFSIAMAGLVGDAGVVLAIDLQQRMLDALMRRAAQAGVAHRIRPHCCTADDIGSHGPADFALACFVVHEVPDQARFLDQVRACLKPEGQFLVLEPKIHVPRSRFDRTVNAAEGCGFRTLDRPGIRLSHAVLLAKIRPDRVK